jgi:hypothetical protein
MSKKISFRGNIPDGLQDKINLRTNNGKVGYKITKFQIISNEPATTTAEIVCKIFDKDQSASVGHDVDFTDGNLLAVAYIEEHSNSTDFGGTNIIFDNKIFNQNIFVTASDGSGGTKSCNYYIELEAMPISDLEATKLTLQSIRTITSR